MSNYTGRNKELRRENDKVYYLKNKDRIRKYQNEYRKRRDGGLYSRYRSAWNRCNNKSHISYKYYGAIGVKFLWNNYTQFKKDMEDSFKKHVIQYGFKDTTLDRLDNNNGYYKENCRWATKKLQNQNKHKLKASKHMPKLKQDTKEWHYRPCEEARKIIIQQHAKALKLRGKQSRNTTIDEIIIRSK